MKELKSIIEMFYHWEATTPDEIFLRQPKGNSWQTLTYAEAGVEARKVSSHLLSLGLNRGDHICILSKNCYHWVIADLAIMMTGCVSVPLYASLPKEQLKVVVEKSDCKAIFVGKLDTWGDKIEAIPNDVKIINFGEYTGNAVIEQGESWSSIIENSPLNQASFIPDLDDLWTIKFTSGTTGEPKGVMHIHRTPALLMKNEKESGFVGIYKMNPKRFFSFLPLNHVGERMGLEVPCLYVGGMISFAESLDTFAKNIRDTQPTILFAVPRIWTKFYLGVTAQTSQKKLDLLFKIPFVSRFIKKKVRTALGLRDAQIVATGAAITPRFLKEWYQSLGLHLIEAYGMTEVCGSMTNGVDLNTPADSVGRAIPHGEVKIDSDTQEILMKSPYMMTGYYKDLEKTKEVLIDGWMHSGDRGSIDSDGFVRVIGRVKDAFKTSKGSYITPNPMEEVLSKNEYIEQCCVAGLGIPQPICMLNLSEKAKSVTIEEVNESLEKSLGELNNNLANYQRVSTIIVDRDEWSEMNNLLTPTLKVKRGELDNKYSQHYLNWHSNDRKVIWINRT